MKEPDLYVVANTTDRFRFLQSGTLHTSKWREKKHKHIRLWNPISILYRFVVFISVPCKCHWFSLIALFLINDFSLSLSLHCAIRLLITSYHIELKVKRIRLNPIWKSIFTSIRQHFYLKANYSWAKILPFKQWNNVTQLIWMVKSTGFEKATSKCFWYLIC